MRTRSMNLLPGNGKHSNDFIRCTSCNCGGVPSLFTPCGCSQSFRLSYRFCRSLTLPASHPISVLVLLGFPLLGLMCSISQRMEIENGV